MNTSHTLFVGLQVASYAVCILVLLKYWQVCLDRGRLFRALGNTALTGRIRMHILLVAAYVVTTVLITTLTGSAFFS
jgi:hypothetical protein